MKTVLGSLPVVARAVVLGAGGVGIVGALAGLIIGMCSYAPTAPFAVIELGVPAAVGGAIAGLVVGSIAFVFRHILRRNDPETDVCRM